jgi:hypothetical protein
MSNRRELLATWEFPHTQRHGVTLVARRDARACLERIFAEGCRFYGYDSFTVFANGQIQPHLEWSPSWKRGSVPDLETIVEDLAAHPDQVTHYEFVFEGAV